MIFCIVTFVLYCRKIGLNESLFKRLDSDNNTVCLRLQYRMNSRIMDVANKLTYNGELLAANEEIAQATLKVKDVSVKCFFFVFIH